jgi:hypothetical protein
MVIYNKVFKKNKIKFCFYLKIYKEYVNILFNFSKIITSKNVLSINLVLFLF